MTIRKQFCGLRRKHWKEDSGQALIELAIVMPVLLLLLLGAAELTIVAYQAIEVANAAKAAVQYGAQNDSASADVIGIQNAALQDASNFMGLQASDVSVTSACNCVSIYDPVVAASNSTNCATTSCTGRVIKTLTVTVTNSNPFNPGIYIPGWNNKRFTLHGRAVQEVMY